MTSNPNLFLFKKNFKPKILSPAWLDQNLVWIIQISKWNSYQRALQTEKKGLKESKDILLHFINPSIVFSSNPSWLDMASMFELVRNVYYFFMGLLVMYVSFLSDQYLWSKETTPAAFQYIEEICIQPNFRNYTFDCTKLLTPDPENVKAVTSKEDLFMVALTKTSTLA